ncbi:MAG: hypothetical protein ACYC3L_01245 [Gemmatimonadaceae bacterium]
MSERELRDDVTAYLDNAPWDTDWLLRRCLTALAAARARLAQFEALTTRAREWDAPTLDEMKDMVDDLAALGAHLEEPNDH